MWGEGHPRPVVLEFWEPDRKELGFSSTCTLSIFRECSACDPKRKSVLPSAAKANAPASQSSVEYSDSSDEEAYRRP